MIFSLSSRRLIRRLFICLILLFLSERGILLLDVSDEIAQFLDGAHRRIELLKLEPPPLILLGKVTQFARLKRIVVKKQPIRYGISTPIIPIGQIGKPLLALCLLTLLTLFFVLAPTTLRLALNFSFRSSRRIRLILRPLIPIGVDPFL